MTKVVSTLASFQERSVAVLVVPDFEHVSLEQLRDWEFAAALLRGHEATVSYTEGTALFAELDAEVDVGDGDLVVVTPLMVTVGGQVIELGRMKIELEGAMLVEKREINGRTFHVLETPNRRVRYRIASD